MNKSKKSISTDIFIETLESYIENIKSSLFSFNKENPKDYHVRIFHNFLQRTYYGTRSILALFKEFEKDTNFKFPIGLQVRTCLLDFLTISYLIKFVGNEQSFRREIARLNCISVKRTYKEIKDDFEQEKLTQNEFEDEIITLHSHFQDNFSLKTGNQLPTLNTQIKPISPKAMADDILAGSLSQHGLSYEIYQYYSKYEHYGTFTKAILDFPPEYEFDKLVLSFLFILRGTRLCYQVMNIDKTKIHEIENMITALMKIPPLYERAY